MSKKRLFVTGGFGFIGSRLVAQAIESGWEIMVLRHPADLGSRGLAWRDQVTEVVGTMANLDEVASVIRAWHPSACAHLAWTTTPGSYLHSRDNLDWLHWSTDLIQKLTGWGCGYVLCVGTCAEYDSRLAYFTEESPIAPSTLYAACKASLRLVAQKLASSDGLGLGWARVYYLYGPGEHELRLVPDCIHTLLGGGRFAATAGTQLRDFLHVDDVAAGLLKMLESKYAGDLNICSSQPATVRTVVETIARVLGRLHLVDFGARHPDAWNPPVLFGANDRLRALGWQPQFSLEAGLEATIRWWEKSPSRR